MDETSREGLGPREEKLGWRRLRVGMLLSPAGGGEGRKALYESIHVEVWGHSISRMLANLPESLKPPEELIDLAKELDRHYIPTRYPNFHPEGAPMDYYTKADAQRAVRNAEEIIKFCRDKIPKDRL